ncbi:MAG TPA: carbohydrate kinase [Saprospirales bacterium]|nr:carbohydrate kinase [Saprospirales bacterium]
MYLIGYDIGSSSVKAALVDASTGKTLGIEQYPEQEMPIVAPQPDWAEQHPEDWWAAVCAATRKLITQTGISSTEIEAIGIAYQMHGLVCLDKHGSVLRPSIIWCDSRAVDIGNRAFEQMGQGFCLQHYLNTPGNFTASKLKWVKEHQPEIFEQIDKVMLPGDYIAYRMTGHMNTTVTGLSEGIMWDFHLQKPARDLLHHFGIPDNYLPELVPICGVQGKLTRKAAEESGLKEGIIIGYRAGDQPNNAMALNVLKPGELAATGGTSGVVYAVSSRPVYDPQQRVNSFAHVNYTPDTPNTGVLLCINGAGSTYRWIRDLLSQNDEKLPYTQLESIGGAVSPGAEGLTILPFGNGAERMLNNGNPGASIHGLNVNRHGKAHLVRAGLEGIAFAFVQGISVFEQLGIQGKIIRVGNDNLFQSRIFAQTISDIYGLQIDVYHTTGAIGAAKASGVAIGLYPDLDTALAHQLKPVHQFNPNKPAAELLDAFQRFKGYLNKAL